MKENKLTPEEEGIFQNAKQQLDKADKLYYDAEYHKVIELTEPLLDIFQKLEKWVGLIETRNHLSRTYIELGQIEQADKYLHDTLILSSKHLKKNAKVIGYIYSILGYLHAQIYHDSFTALPYFQKTFNIWKRFEDMISENAVNIANIGFCYSLKEDYENALEYYQKSFNDQKEWGKAAALDNIGNCYYEYLQDYERGILYIKQALELRKKSLQANHPKIAFSYRNIGVFYSMMKQGTKGKEYLQKALEIVIENFGENHQEVGAIYRELGEVSLRLKDYSVAMQCFQKALSIQCQLLGDSHVKTGMILESIASVYKKLNQTEDAIHHYQAAQKSYLNSVGLKHPKMANNFRFLSNCHIEKGNYEKAFVYLQKALQSLFNTPIPSDIYEPLLSLVTISDLTLLDVLLSKGKLLLDYYQSQSKQKRDLQAAFDTFLSTEALVKRIKQSYRTQNSSLLFANKTLELYEKSIETALLMPNSQDFAFSSSEKAKAHLLLSSMQNNQAKTAIAIPDELLQKEKQLKIELTYLEKRIQKEEAKKDKKNEKSIKKWEKAFFDFHEEYTQLLQQLETNYPDYYQLKYDTKTATPTELQSTLTENQALVSYFVGKESIYIFVVTPDEFEVEEFEKPDDFEGMIQSFLKSIHAHDKADYLQLAYELYELLIAPIELHWYNFAEEEGSPQQLILIPHAELSYLPFEALISEQADENTPYQELNYLVQNYEISYHYSATLWQYAQGNKGERADTEHSFVGFAPVYEEEVRSRKEEAGSNVPEEGVEGALKLAAKEVAQWATRSEALRSDGTWTPLPHSKEEAENIAALFEGKGLSSEIYLHEEATKERFQEAVGKARYLLVAAHGVVNDEKTALSGLVFYPNSVEPLSRSATVDKVLTREAETLSTAESLDNSWNDGESKNDCILSMEETYPLNIQADLVVLSSCESGIGKLHKGEGMMAVNRGFLAAGAKNVISTLFKVYDKPSSLLTQYLFEGILEGEEYSSALRKAKLKLLEVEGVSPKSWCGFVLIGG